MESHEEQPSDIQTYFLEKLKGINNSIVKKTAANQADATVVTLQQQIEEDAVQISERQRHVEKRQAVEEPTENKQDRLKEILQKKQQMVKRLNMMELQESKLKQKVRHSQPLLHKPKSHMTQDDIHVLKQLNHSYKKFEKQLEKKTKEYEERLKAFKEEEKQLENSHKQEISKAKRDEIMQKLDLLRQREQERQQKFAQDQKAFAEVKSKRMLYQQWQQKYLQQQEQQQKKAAEMQQEARRIKETDFERIKEHKKNYEQLLQRQKEERANKMAEIRRALQEKEQKYPQSRFYSYVREEQTRKQQQQEERSRFPKINFDKRMQYSEKVKNEILPTLKVRKSAVEQAQKKPQIRSMSVNQLFKHGNEYMSKANNIARMHHQSHVEDISKAQNKEQANKTAIDSKEPFRYKNYLNELKMNRTGQQKTELDKVRAIIDKDDLDQDRLFQAKLLAAKMEKSAGNNSKKLMDSIQAKIQILNKLT